MPVSVLGNFIYNKDTAVSGSAAWRQMAAA